MAKLSIERASIVIGKKSGDFHSKSGDREIFIILSKIGRSPAKSGDLEALKTYDTEINYDQVRMNTIVLCFVKFGDILLWQERVKEKLVRRV